MATFTLRAHGHRSVADSWERYADPQRWSEWSPQIRSVSASADRLAVGVTGKVRPWVGPSAPFTVTAYDEVERAWSWQVGWSVLTVSLDHEVGRTPAGSETMLRLRGPLAIVAAYLPVAQFALRRLVAA